MTAPKLKPCPFCGGEATFAFATRGWKVECAGRFGVCLINARTHYQHTKTQAFIAWNTRADLIDMDVLRKVEAGYTKSLAEAESWIHDQLDGTGHVEAALADLNDSRAALTDLRAMMEKLK